MKARRFTEERIIAVLKENGDHREEICRKHGICD
jgi:transposase-like protein